MYGIFHKSVLNYQLVYFASALMRVMLRVEIIRYLVVNGTILGRSLFHEIGRQRSFVRLRAALDLWLFLGWLLDNEIQTFATDALLRLCARCFSWLIWLTTTGEPLPIANCSFLLAKHLVVHL